ncbi:hypothetical protein A4X16_11385 [Microbacterium sp. H83]|nr:hypothetical protein A4X16_11385 [Microbacterium sp. H83]
MRGLIASAAAIVLSASLLVAVPSTAIAAPVPASGTVSASTSDAVSAATQGPASAGIAKTANLALFRPGNIISDAVFFDSSTLNAAQIDSFLRSKVPACQSGNICLKDWRQNTPTRPADNYCRGYAGAGNESAATIIAKVAQSCGINPQVLVVMLEKEQSLVTHTYPSIGRYNAAMGQGCPDTAGCDPNYAGFFYQVYGAARQMKIYAEGRYFTYYAPGKTWNILYNPERACGSSPVYVENIATSALYYYTPYQPNRAALNAGYGKGDGCSAYGNRNFYQFFTDWFGSTQSRYSSLVQGVGQVNVYLVSGGLKWRVSNLEDLAAFQSRLGGVTAVPASYVDSLPTGSDVTRYVHDARTGTLYIIDPDGTKHRFVNADQVARFGYSFPSYVNVDPTILDRFTTGADVADFFRIWDGPDLYLFDKGTKRHIATYATWQSVSKGTPGYVAYMPSTPAKALPNGPAIIAANTLVRAASSGDVQLALPSGSLLRIPSFALAAEFGATTYAILPDASLAANPRLSGSLSPMVQCGTTTYIAAAGRLTAVTGTALGGVTPVKLSAEECGGFTVSSSTLASPLFFQVAGSPEVYTLDGGKLRHVRSYALLQELNGSRPLSLVAWSRATVNDLLTGPYLEDGVFVSFTGQSEVYQHTAGQLRHVPDYATLLTLNGGRVPSILSLKADWKAMYKVGSPVLANGTFVQFAGQGEVYRYNEGQLQHVQSYASLVRLGSGRVPTIVTLAADLKAAYSMGTPIP